MCASCYLMDSLLSHDGVPDAWHFMLAIYFALFFVAASFFFDKFLFRRLATWLLRKGIAPLKLNEANRGKIMKCSESMWKLTYYATVETCVLRITYREPWFRDTQEYLRGWPNQELTLPLKLFYMCQCGFYLYSIAALLTWETRRKDFAVMMAHHVITVLLIGYSYITRIGSVVLALHDASDVFMEAAKVFKYSEKELAASVCFGFFAISWLILRLIFFPFWVIRTSSYDMRDYLKLSEPYPKSLYYIFNTMLLMLLVFHMYWWILICSMILRQLKNKGKVGEDIRSGMLRTENKLLKTGLVLDNTSELCREAAETMDPLSLSLPPPPFFPEGSSRSGVEDKMNGKTDNMGKLEGLDHQRSKREE